jgi:hypothetical protein
MLYPSVGRGQGRARSAKRACEAFHEVLRTAPIVKIAIGAVAATLVARPGFVQRFTLDVRTPFGSPQATCRGNRR